jgi:hypothetical protein
MGDTKISFKCPGCQNGPINENFLFWETLSERFLSGKLLRMKMFSCFFDKCYIPNVSLQKIRKNSSNLRDLLLEKYKKTGFKVSSEKGE